MRMENLNLSDNQIGSGQNSSQAAVCSALSSMTFPSMRELLLRQCFLSHGEIGGIADCMARGGMMQLEVLDLEHNKCVLPFLGRLGRALRKDVVPRLRTVNLTDARALAGAADKEGMRIFLEALGAPDCPPQLRVPCILIKKSELRDAEVRALGAGKYPSLPGLRLCLESQAAVFLREVVRAAEVPKFEDLELFVEGGEEVLNPTWELLGDVLQARRFGFLRRLKISGRHVNEDLVSSESRRAFFSGLSVTRLPMLRNLYIAHVLLSDTDLTLFAEAVREGNLSGLHALSLCGLHTGTNSLLGFGRVGMEALMSAVVQSAEGLPHLRDLSFAHTYAGEGVVSLVAALLSGKLSKVCNLNLKKSLLMD
mmetsp:Transcript_19902/g.40014  ORF Transcript_19902/g.40014 Transcript_19902/m.40014 type:complete len:367 (+) Transcript_19902:123-1223(+)